MNPTTRRQFLAQTAGAGVLGWRALHAQTPQTVPVPGLETGDVIRTFALRNVTVIDGTGKPAQRAMTVVISGTRIQSVQPSDGRLAAGVETVDASGKFLIPGLWDMHVHTGDTAGGWAPHAQFTANGVTGVRVMLGSPSVRRIRDETAAGKRLGPRMIVGSTVLERPDNRVADSIWRYPATAEEGRSAVRDEIRNGAAFIKVYGALTRDVYFAIADEARRQRVPFVGHAPRSIMLAECVAAGQKSIEHLTEVLMESSSAGATFKKALIQTGRAPGTPPDLKTIVDTFDETRATAVVSLFRNSRTWHCPTLTVLRGRSGDSSLADDPRLCTRDSPSIRC